MRVPFVVVVLVAISLAGCTGKGGGPVDPTLTPVPVDWAMRALAHKDGHDHNSTEQHVGMTTPNFEILGWDPLVTTYYGASAGGYYCGGVTDAGERSLAVVHSFTSDVAVVIADVTDPMKPQYLGELVLPKTHIYDADIFPDGRYLVLASSESSSEAPDGAAPATFNLAWKDYCSGEVTVDETPYQSGVLLVDLEDPRNPRVADFYPTTGFPIPTPNNIGQPGVGVHSIFATMVDSTRWILGSSTSLVHQASYFTFLNVQAAPTGAKLVPYGIYSSQYVGPPAGANPPPLWNGHVDGWIQKHPGNGQTLAYLANWNGGLVIVKIDGGGRFTRVGGWTDHPAGSPDERLYPGTTGQIHEALPMPELWDGKHYTFIGQEVLGPPNGRPSGHVLMLDTTDPADPRPIARWVLPVHPGWTRNDDLVFSTHYVEVVDRTLFVSMYHGGVWAAGTTPVEGTKELPTLGVFVPDRMSPKPPPTSIQGTSRLAPEVLDVLATKDGNLVSFDGNSGVYVYRFDPSRTDVPVPAPWTADGGLK